MRYKEQFYEIFFVLELVLSWPHITAYIAADL